MNTEQIIKSIYEQYELENAQAKKRMHLGASVIGDKCNRYIYQEFRWYADRNPEGRILRLFDTGKREEDRVLNNLAKIGFVFKTDSNGQQISFQDKSGHIGGSVDAIITHIPNDFGSFDEECVLEVKTHSEKNFKKLEKEKVHKAYPRHYSQMQYYMGSLNLNHALYIAVNKNTDELYMEFILFDEFHFLVLKDKAESTVVADKIPQKISQLPTWWECKICKFYDICHQDVEPNKNCRTCIYSAPMANGEWGCKLHKKNLSYNDQIQACSEYTVNK